MDESSFLQLLRSLRSEDNAFRNAAEAQYNALCESNGTWVLHALAEISAAMQDEALVTLCLTLLRKMLGAESSSYELCDAETQSAVRARMLQTLSAAAFGPQRKSAAACVSVLAVKVHKMGHEWNELWQSVYSIITDATSGNEVKMVCCEIISTTSPTLSDLFKQNASAIASGLHNCLTVSTKANELKEAAVDALCNLASLGLLSELAPLVPDVLNAVQQALSAQDWEAAEELISKLCDGIAKSPALFENYSSPLLSGLMQAAANPAVDAAARHMAIESMVTYCETSPQSVRKVPHFCASLLELLFRYMLNPNYEDDWDVRDIHEDEAELEDDSDLVIGSGGLDRLAVALGGRKLKGTVQQLFSDNIQKAAWQERNAALLLICYVAEGFYTVFQSILGSLVPAIAPFTMDEVKYVRASALDCLSQLSSDFGPQLQNELHEQVLPNVIKALRDPIPRISASAARCLDSFFDNVVDDEDSDPDVGKVFAPYVQRVCEDCVSLLRSTPHNFVRESALGALSSLTSTCKDLLTPYVSALVPVYQEVLAVPDSPDVMNIKCKAIECVTLLACGVGREAFAPYAKDVCDYLVQLSSSTISQSDVRLRFILRGWTCMVECQKNDILPYLDVVMPMLIGMMNVECDAVISNAPVGDEDEDSNKDEDSNVKSFRFIIPGVGEKVAKFHTGLIEDKELASNVINAMLQELGLSLAPYFASIAQSAISLLGFTVDSGIRENGALIINEIMEACSKGEVAESQELAVMSLEPLMTALEEESECDVMETLMQVVSQCIRLHPTILNAENIALVGDKLLATLDVMNTKRLEALEAKRAEHDEDEVDKLDAKIEELQESIHSASDLIGTLLERAGVVFAPLFVKNFFPVIATWMHEGTQDEFNVARALTIICDFVEHAPQHIVESLPNICATARTYVTRFHNPDVQQSSIYLVNLLTQYLASQAHIANINVHDFIHQAHSVLQDYFNTKESKSSKYSHCTCNAVSAYVSLLHFFGQTTLQSESTAMLETIVSHLPACSDDVEATRVHDRVLDWIVQNSPLIQANPAAAMTIVQRLKNAKPQTLSAKVKQHLETM